MWGGGVKFFILTAVTGAFFQSKPELFSSRLTLDEKLIFERLRCWELISLLELIWGDFYSISGPLSSKRLFVQYVKMADTHGNVGRMAPSFLKNKLHNL